jgi:hypothetical protein
MASKIEVNDSVSHHRKFTNEMKVIEKNMDIIIEPYTIICCDILLHYNNTSCKPVIVNLIKSLFNLLGCPFIYCFWREDKLLLLLFLPKILNIHSKDENIKFLVNENGEYLTTKLCSYVSCHIYSQINRICICHCMKFETQSNAVCYLIWHIHENCLTHISKLTNNTLTRKDLTNMTLDDIINKLSSMHINWDDVPEKDKYGYVLKQKDSISKEGTKETKIITKTLLPLFIDFEKTMSFLF